MRFYILFILSYLLISCGGSKSSANYSYKKKNTDTFKVAFWNVENLFDTIDGPNMDEDFLPNGNYKWTSQIYLAKIDNLARVISDINADIIGLCEVENYSVLVDLNKKLGDKFSYEILHYDSPDERGIDVALFYNSNKFDHVSSKPHHVNLGSKDKTRDILEVRLYSYDAKDTFSFYVNHWPSRRGGAIESNPSRFSAASVLKKAIEQNSTNFIAMGDLNDGSLDSSLTQILKTDTPGVTNGQLYDLSRLINTANQGSHRYRDEWNMLDHLIIPSSIWQKNQGWTYVDFSFKIFSPNYLIQQSGKYQGYPFRGLAGSNWLGGYSDHLPIVCKIAFIK
jgi:predicted extracellular nuclease